MLSQEEQNIAENVRQLMEDRDPPLSIRGLAEQTDLNHSTLHKFLQGHHQPRYAMIKTLAKFFKVGVEALERTPKRPRHRASA